MATWRREDVELALRDKGWPVEPREIQNGVQYVLTDGTPIDWYTTGRVVVRGKTSALKQEAEKVFASETTSLPRGSPTTQPKRVFIVYGHDVQAREQLELIIRRLRLEPIILQSIPSSGDTIIEKLEAFTAADFACVLLTPDDEGRRYGFEEDLRPRARQNVVLELGMVLARLGRRNVAILVKGDELQRPSDIEGLIYIPFKERGDEARNHLAANLQKAGFPIQVADLLS